MKTLAQKEAEKNTANRMSEAEALYRERKGLAPAVEVTAEQDKGEPTDQEIGRGGFSRTLAEEVDEKDTIAFLETVELGIESTFSRLKTELKAKKITHAQALLSAKNSLESTVRLIEEM